ncbi:DgyrCDS13909 [Dimorphilus gyrociliatus]|uniref:DgyrCDS13909 n=1 Tax=Dimorphilus gyrociliatus TaxID=2664684 RepID=A0A7I8WC23_9ANNE|nr:DgyrCDS13909 [Dimorphilus gyrociliatus]
MVEYSLYYFLVILSCFEIAYPKIIAWTQNEHSWTRVRFVDTEQNYDKSRLFDSYPHFKSQQIGITYDNCNQRWITSLNNGSLMSIAKRNDLMIDNMPTATSISFDDENNQFYWTSKGIIGIGLSKYGHVKDIWKALFTEQVETPTSIVVQDNYIFWSDIGRGTIEKSSKSGNDREIIYNFSSNAIIGANLAIHDNRIFVLERRKTSYDVFSLQFDGQARKYHIFENTNTVRNTFSVFDDKIILVDENTLDMEIHIKTTFSIYQREKLISLDALTEHLAFKTQDKGECKECEICSDFCFVEGCRCRQNAILELDKRNCIPHNPKIVFSMTNQVYWSSFRIPPSVNEEVYINPIPFGVDFVHLESIAYYNEEDLLFLSDTGSQIMYSSKVDGSRMFEMLVNTRDASGSIVDWISGQLYWSDWFSKRIMTAKLDARYPSVFFEAKGMERITSMAIDAVGINFFTKVPTLFISTEKEIHSVDLANKNLKKIYESEYQIKNIIFDSRENRLCFSCYPWKIGCLNAKGEYFFKKPATQSSSIGGLSSFGDVWIWTADNSNLRVGRGELGESLRQQKISKQDLNGKAEDSILFSNYMQPKSKSNSLCHQLNQGNVCSCGIGFQLDKDYKTCKPAGGMKTSQFLLFTDPYHKQFYQASIQSNGNVSITGTKHLPDFPHTFDMDPEVGSLVWIDSHPLSVSKLYLANFMKPTRVNLILNDIRKPLKVRTYRSEIYVLFKNEISRLEGDKLSIVISNISSGKDMAINNNGLFFTDSRGLHVANKEKNTFQIETIYFEDSCNAISILDDEVS